MGFSIEVKGDRQRISNTRDSRNWTDDELRASVAIYLDMLAKERRGEKFVKKEYIQRLLGGALIDRNRGSVEYRFQNISSVLHDQGLAWVSGYKPQSNVGSNVAAKIRDILVELGAFDPDDFQPTADRDEFERRASNLQNVGIVVKPAGEASPKQTSSTSTIFIRDPRVKAWVLENAKGVCECCGEEAPFKTEAGRPYLEVHHVKPLADGGPDTVENAVGVCPNCHRGFHQSIDRDKMVSETIRRIVRLGSS